LVHVSRITGIFAILADIRAGAKEHIQMLKQRKKISSKVYSRYRNLFKYNKTCINPVYLLTKHKLPKYGFVLKATQNNVFCTLINCRTKKILLNTSSGKEKIKVSRKNLAFGAKNIIISFFKKSTKKFSGSTIFVKILAPLRVKTIFLRALKNYSKNARLLINTIHKKCFNGCKVPKKKRKKQRGLRVFK
jgi:ribosomal protein S11